MKNTFTFMMAFCLMALSSPAQTVDVVTGLGFPYTLALHGNELYISENLSDRISKIDITQANPTTTHVLDDPFPLGMVIDGNELYYSSYSSGKVYKADLTETPLSPQLVVDVSWYTSILLIVDNQLFIIDDIGGAIVKVDLDQPNSDPTIFVQGLSAPFGMVSDGDFLYVSEFDAGRISKVDLSQPNPVPTTVITGLDLPVGLYLNGNFLYVAYGGNFPNGKIGRLDISQPDPTVEVLATGLHDPQLCAFSGLDLYIVEAGSHFDPTGKISKLAITQAVFSPLGTVCDNVSTTLGGASPTGGIYSGNGVTDDGNGATFTFDPAGPGTYFITYTLSNGQSVNSTVAVLAPPVVTGQPDGALPLNFPPTPLNDGFPEGGVYSGPGILPGNIFDAMVAGIGVHTITYTYTDVNGCSGSATTIVTVYAPGDACSGAIDINNLLGGPQNEPQTSSLQNNTGCTSTNDPAVGTGCFFNNDPLQHSVWYEFTGDGNVYRIRSVQCSATNYIQEGDTQAAVFTGSCSNPIQLDCNDDENAGSGILSFNLVITTQPGEVYGMLVDGFGGYEGEFCIEVTNLTPSGIVEIGNAGIRVFPNPTTGAVQLTGVNADQAQVFDNLGRLVLQVNNPGTSIDLANNPAGIYLLKITEGTNVYSAKVVKE